MEVPAEWGFSKYPREKIPPTLSLKKSEKIGLREFIPFTDHVRFIERWFEKKNWRNINGTNMVGKVFPCFCLPQSYCRSTWDDYLMLRLESKSDRINPLNLDLIVARMDCLTNQGQQGGKSTLGKKPYSTIVRVSFFILTQNQLTFHLRRQSITFRPERYRYIYTTLHINPSPDQINQGLLIWWANNNNLIHSIPFSCTDTEPTISTKARYCLLD